VYVDDFVYFSDDPAVELEFERLLQEEVKTDFMGPVDWFLGTSFDWKRHGDGELSVHLSQAVPAISQNVIVSTMNPSIPALHPTGPVSQ
jgi:hypothetical protein